MSGMKKKPQVDALHIGARYGSLSGSNLNNAIHALEEAETDARQKGYINAPQDVALFRKGWFVGIANREIEELRWMMQNRLKRHEIQAIGELIAGINKQYKESTG